MNWLKQLFFSDPIFGGVPRSSKWRGVRQSFLALNPECAVCGTKKNLECHHIEPYHLNPEMELKMQNLITLCERDHLLFGHLNSFLSHNKKVREDAVNFRGKITSRP